MPPFITRCHQISSGCHWEGSFSTNLYLIKCTNTPLGDTWQHLNIQYHQHNISPPWTTDFTRHQIPPIPSNPTQSGSPTKHTKCRWTDQCVRIGNKIRRVFHRNSGLHPRQGQPAQKTCSRNTACHYRVTALQSVCHYSLSLPRHCTTACQPFTIASLQHSLHYRVTALQPGSLSLPRHYSTVCHYRVTTLQSDTTAD